jgi:alpha-glucosidase
MKKSWWKEVVVYEIYPRSFMDSNGDGIGDLRGIISKLEYLKDLGIDVIWICPMYKSPNDDNGYDISDYQDIMNEFGTMNDFDDLLNEVHKHNMKLIIDLVINHTSDEHPWFIESISSKDNPKRDWYIWRDGKNGKEPNNWESIFGGSVWEYDEKTEQYFFHLFSRRQPDLNWENEDMRLSIYKMINWWLDKGVDGFRVDAISHIKKEKGLEDMPNPQGLKYVHSFAKHMNVAGIHMYLKDIKENTFSKYDIMTVGEANGVKIEDVDLWVGEKQGKFNMIFQFEHLDLWDTRANKEIDVVGLKEILTKWQKGLENKGWNALYIENHDITRAVSTLGDDTKYWSESATSLAVMYFLMQGTPFIYQGQELGMTNVKFKNIEDYNDVRTKNMYKIKKEKGISNEEIMKEVWATSRDNSRTPMQWDESENSGFTTGKPWIGINPNYKEINVLNQKKDSNSILNFYKKMISIKKENNIFTYGVYNLILEDHKQIYAYTRILKDNKVIIICNLTDRVADYKYDNIELSYNKLMLSNYNVKPHVNITNFILKPYEARVYKFI